MNIEPSSPETDSSSSTTAATAQTAEAVSLSPRELLLRLQQEFAFFRDFKPLALRIDKSIIQRFPEVDKKNVRTAMRLHTTSTRYLKAVAKGSVRYDLEGKESGEVTAEHREYAEATLKERFAAVAERKRAQEKQEKAKQREQEALQLRDEKLQQLLGRFSRR